MGEMADLDADQATMIDFEDDPPSREREHYIDVLYQPDAWRWVDGSGRQVDLRKVDLRYACNILRWMEKHSTDDTPYKELEQYAYLQKRIPVLEARQVGA